MRISDWSADVCSSDLQGPMCGQAGHFRNYAPEKIPYAIDRYTNEANRLYRVLDTRLAGRAFIAGAYSIADMACWPWILFRAHHGVAIEDYPDLHRWYRSDRSEEHTSELQSLMRISYAVFCLKKKRHDSNNLQN